MTRWALGLWLPLALGCGKDEASPAPEPVVAGTPVAAPSATGSSPVPATPVKPPSDLDGAIESMRATGLEMAAFAPDAARMGELGATACSRGTVGGLDVLVCEHKNERDADLAMTKVGAFGVDAITAITRRSGRLVVAIADRSKADLKGEKILRVLAAVAPDKGQPSGQQ